MHQWRPIPGFEGRAVAFGITSALHCQVCGSRCMSWQDDGIITHHYANRSLYLGTTEPECIEADIELTFNSFQPHPTMTTATIKRIEQMAKSMIGQTYLFMQDKAPHTIQNYELRNNRLIISSDQRMFNFEAKNALKLMEAFRKVEAPLEETITFSQPDQEAQDCTEMRIDEALASEAKRKADEIFEGVKAMAKGHASIQPDAEQVPGEPESVEQLDAEVREMQPQSESACATSIVVEMKELAEAVVGKARVMGIQGKTELAAKAGKSMSDRPWPVALYRMLTPIVTDYEKAMDRVRHYSEAKSINNPIYLHKDAGAVDAETAEAIYTLAIDRAQQELEKTEHEFRQVIVDYIGITR